MHIVDDPVETIHVYMVKEEEKQAPLLLPLFAALLCLAVITSVAIYSGSHPAYEHETLTVPAHFLPLKVFRAEAPIIPTGIKTYPATYAIGTLTLTNGSILSEVPPQGVIFNAVYGTALYVRNITSFHGGNDSYTEPLRLPKDRQTALTGAKLFLTTQQAHIPAILAQPCS